MRNARSPARDLPATRGRDTEVSRAQSRVAEGVFRVDAVCCRPSHRRTLSITRVVVPRLTQYVSSNGVRIYRIPCLALPDLPLRVYLLVGAGPPTLVDAGSGIGQCTAEILSGIDRVRHEFGEPIAPADIRRIIITHAHLDHFGGLSQLVRIMPAEVVAHPLDAGALAAWEEYAVMSKQRLGLFLVEAGVDQPLRGQLLVASRFERARLEPVRVDRRLSDGQELDGLKIIHTPGHSAGHCCIAVGDVLLTADHILARTVPQQWPERISPFLGLAHYLDSLRRVEPADGFRLGLASHEEAIHNLAHRIETIRQSHRRRCDRLLGFIADASRPPTLTELAQQMYGELAGFRGVLALTDVGARIEYLQQLGEVRLANLDEIEADHFAPWRFAR